MVWENVPGAGSPPRMRGKAARRFAGNLHPGITPAYAGKGSSAKCLNPVYSNHPRVCGERYGGQDRDADDAGSPPRMRGKADRMQFYLSRPGITPAYAGKGHLLPVVLKQYRDHPRVCGERYQEYVAAEQAEGSPPRMRGKGYDIFFALALLRITPAYAGKGPPAAA